MITATAPGQCSLAGDSTDLWGGSVLACSLRERAHCSLNTDVEETAITVLGRHQTVKSADDLVLGDDEALNIARAALAALEVLPGQSPPFHLVADCEVPLQAGLAASTALLATITGCLLTHLELRLNPYEIAELVRKIECDVLGVSCGFQYHYMTVFGGLAFLDFRGKNSALAQEPTMPFATVEQLEKYVGDLPILVACRADLPVPVPPAQAENTQTAESGEPIARLARAAKRAVLACDWDACAGLINRSHMLAAENRDVIAETMALIDAARNGGAAAAKATGHAILTLTHDPARTAQALQAAGATHIFSPHPSPGLTVSVELTV